MCIECDTCFFFIKILNMLYCLTKICRKRLYIINWPIQSQESVVQSVCVANCRIGRNIKESIMKITYNALKVIYIFLYVFCDQVNTEEFVLHATLTYLHIRPILLLKSSIIQSSINYTFIDFIPISHY